MQEKKKEYYEEFWNYPRATYISRISISGDWLEVVWVNYVTTTVLNAAASTSLHLNTKTVNVAQKVCCRASHMYRKYSFFILSIQMRTILKIMCYFTIKEISGVSTLFTLLKWVFFEGRQREFFPARRAKIEENVVGSLGFLHNRYQRDSGTYNS